MDATGLLDAPASIIAEAVRTGQVTATDVVEAHLTRIAERDAEVGAFVAVLASEARAEAAAVDAHPDRATLPLAGVPVGIKNNTDVAGHVTRHGSTATGDRPADADDLVVARLRAAGAVVIGLTRCPELSVFGNSDDADGAARNPWDPSRVAGGSSGGSAAAVAAGLVPLAHASDGMGSIRIPAAACGLVGLKPGRGTIPVEGDLDGQHWFGMTQNGAVATTVGDLTLALDAMADTERFAAAGPPDRRLRIAVSTASVAPGVIVGREQRRAVARLAVALRDAGHDVVRADPPYDTVAVVDLVTRWTAGAAADVEALAVDRVALQARTRRHAAVGRVLGRVRGVEDAQADRWKAKVDEFLSSYDLLLTPVMASAPPRGHGWWQRGWLRNLLQGLLWAPFASPWNLAELPAAVVPAGLDQLRMPLSVQVVAPRGNEDDLVAALRLLEQVAPWQRRPSRG